MTLFFRKPRKNTFFFFQKTLFQKDLHGNYTIYTVHSVYIPSNNRCTKFENFLLIISGDIRQYRIPFQSVCDYNFTPYLITICQKI